MNRAAVVPSGFATLFALLLGLGPAAGVAAAEPERKPPGDGGAEARPRPKPPMSALPQKVLKVDERTITVIPAMMFDDGPAPVEETLRIDKERTKVFVFEAEEEKQLEDGGVRTRGTFRPGTLEDLKAGQTVRYTAKDGLAGEIRIMPSIRAREGRGRRGGPGGPGKGAEPGSGGAK